MGLSKMVAGVARFVFKRLREPSTYAGLAALAAGVGHPGGAELINKIGQAVPLVLGAVAVVLPDAWWLKGAKVEEGASGQTSNHVIGESRGAVPLKNEMKVEDRA